MPFDATPDAEVTARDRVIRLRDFLETLPEHRFDMRTWGWRDSDYQRHTCGTAACIGGWANVMFADRLLSHFDTGALLGLTAEQTSDLFTPRGWETFTPSPADAVAVLDNYLATGKIDWSVAK